MGWNRSRKEPLYERSIEVGHLEDALNRSEKKGHELAQN